MSAPTRRYLGRRRPAPVAPPVRTAWWSCEPCGVVGALEVPEDLARFLARSHDRARHDDTATATVTPTHEEHPDVAAA